MPTSPDRAISVLVADDAPDMRLLLERILSEADWGRPDVTTVPDGREALRELREHVYDVVLLDLNMPGLDGLEVFEAIGEDPQRPQVIFVSGEGTVAAATRAMKLGAFDFLEKPVDPDRLTTLVWRAARTHDAIASSERLREVVARDSESVNIVTSDARMEACLALAAKVANSDVAVLIHGESGTGKELIAREVHRLSDRASEPLVALNCAAVAESLAESELFGHEKGAFTGAATKKLGLTELADGGTLFLDEIGDLALPLQAKLLRVLETKRFRRVGGVKEYPANFRLVSATHRPLASLVESETFRRDLFYRINAIELELPPLRDRSSDIPLLVSHFLDEFRPGDSEWWSIENEALELLRRYPWPGNVRELRNVIERAALLARGQTIRVADLGSLLSASTPGEAASAEATGRGLPTLELAELEEIAIKAALDRSGWHQGRAADALGVSARTLHRKIRSLGLEKPRG